MSRFLKALLAFYVYGNFHISLGAVALGDITFILLGTHIPFWLAIFIFCATFCLYNLQRVYASWKLSDVERQTTERHDWVTNMRIPMTLLTIAALLVGAISVLKSFAFIENGVSEGSGYSLNFSENAIHFYLSCIVAGVISIGYALPIIPARPRWKRLRDLPGIKVMLVAFVWGIVTVIWPYTIIPYHVEDLTGTLEPLYFICKSEAAISWIIIVIIYIYAITIPFDIRDYLIDGAKVRSLPVVLGIRRARIIAILLLLLVVGVCITAMVLLQHLNMEFLMIALVCVPTAIVIGFATPKRHEYYYSLLTDGLLLVLWFAVWLAFRFMH
jgi:hypothetical protein